MAEEPNPFEDSNPFETPSAPAAGGTDTGYTPPALPAPSAPRAPAAGASHDDDPFSSKVEGPHTGFAGAASTSHEDVDVFAAVAPPSAGVEDNPFAHQDPGRGGVAGSGASAFLAGAGPSSTDPDPSATAGKPAAAAAAAGAGEDEDASGPWWRRSVLPGRSTDGFKEGFREGCRGLFKTVAASTPAFTFWIGLVGACNFGMLVFSFFFLSSNSRTGSGCSSDNCDSTTASNCWQLMVIDSSGDATCDGFCSQTNAVQYRIAGGALADIGSVWCTFNAINTEWRVGLSLCTAAMLLGGVLYMGEKKGSKFWMTLCRYATVVSVALWFFVMCKDSDSVRKGTSQCSSKLEDIIEEQYVANMPELDCQMASYVTVCLLDASMVVLSIFTVFLVGDRREHLRNAPSA